MSRVTLDFGNMLAGVLERGGIDPDALDGALAERFGRAREELEARREAGELGFLELPYADETAERVRSVADGFGQWFEDLVVLGIGGSALGTRTLGDALLPPGWNELDGEARNHYPRLHVVDNPDPRTLSALLDRLVPGRTLFNVVSKSGSTAETMALFQVADAWLRSSLGEGEARGHFLFTTDPERGALRRIAEAEGVPALPVPPSVGGRFSVLSSVSLFPAAAVGIDTAELLAGAREMEARCRNDGLTENPAGLLAVLLHAAHADAGAGTHVLMPYADRLRTLGLWFQQIWAESLGKTPAGDGSAGEAGGGVGPTPLAAVGATDQHSILQLLMEGPRDKVVCFVGVRARGEDVEIPGLHPGMDALSYLGGHTLGHLLETERGATAEALRRRGRMNLTLELERVDARALGELFVLFEVATVYAGALYGVNPMNQPGVELGKELTYGLLGRAGYDAPEPGTVDPRWRV